MLDFHLNSLTFNDFPQYQPPLSARGQLSVPNFEKGGIKKMSVWEDLRVPAMIICLGAYYVFWIWDLNFKCWSWSVLAKQPINQVLLLNKNVQHVEITRAFCLPGGLIFSMIFLFPGLQ